MTMLAMMSQLISSGLAHVIGETSSADFPITPEAFRQTLGGPRDAFILKASYDGSGLLYSTFLGGISDEIGYGITVDEESQIYVTGWTNSGDFPITPGAFQTSGGNDAFVTKFELGHFTIVYDPSTLSECEEERECPAIPSQTQGYGGDPINTRTGGYSEIFEDLSIPTSAGNLSFQRTYSSQATEQYTTTLGFGWTHNHDTRLVFPDDPGGQAGLILFKAHSANLYYFTDNGDQTYTAAPGVVSTLALDAGQYRLTDPAQRVYTFDGQGKLLTWEGAQGHRWTYTYIVNQLDRVTDDSGLRYLDFDYGLQGRLERVADHTGREVSFTYDTSGDLNTFTDVLEQVWNYTYDSYHHLR